MILTITPANVTTEAEAIERLKAKGYHTLTLDIPPADNEFHWHDFDSTFFVVDGGLAIRREGDVDDRQVCVGDQVDAPRGDIHRERHDGFRAVFGFSIDPATMTMPIDKEPPFPGR